MREEDYGNEMIREVLHLGEEPQFENSHFAEKSTSNKDLLKKLKTHGRCIRKIKKQMSLLQEEILSTCHAREGEGEEVEREGG